MRILIPLTPTNNSTENPFVSVLKNGLTDLGHEVVCSKELFWYNPYDFDIIFFQWPEAILNLKHQKSDMCCLASHIEKIKTSGIPLIITCHNLHPHSNDVFVSQVYDYLYGQVDVFLHMGKYSCSIMKNKYPSASHIIVPHPIFYDVEKCNLSIEECKRKYGVQENNVTIISFGAFRNKQEHDLILNLRRSMPHNVSIWAPRFYTKQLSNKNVINKLFTYSWNYLKYSLQGIKMNCKLIKGAEVISMINAADILLIQRNNVLNSGNLPLGFSAKKIVVGPNVGNVGEILTHTGNPVFDPNDFDSICRAVKQAMTMYYDSNKRGNSNYYYAINNWSQKQIIEQIHTILLSLKKIK